MTKDTIFLMISNVHDYGVFEYVEENETLKLTHVADFASTWNGYSTLVLPQVIKPMENGKFIFFPRETQIVQWIITNRFKSTISFDAIEVWEKNKTLTRSPLELPINFTAEIWKQSFWILQM